MILRGRSIHVKKLKVYGVWPLPLSPPKNPLFLQNFLYKMFKACAVCKYLSRCELEVQSHMYRATCYLHHGITEV